MKGEKRDAMMRFQSVLKSIQKLSASIAQFSKKATINVIYSEKFLSVNEDFWRVTGREKVLWRKFSALGRKILFVNIRESFMGELQTFFIYLLLLFY